MLLRFLGALVFTGIGQGINKLMVESGSWLFIELFPSSKDNFE